MSALLSGGVGITAVAAMTATGLLLVGAWGVVRARDILRALLSAIALLASVTLIAVTLARGLSDPAAAANAHAIVLLAWAVEVVDIVIALALSITLARRGLLSLARLKEGRW